MITNPSNPAPDGASPDTHIGHAAHSHPAAEQRLAWALQTCAKAGIRVTPNRHRVLEVLASEHTPINLDSIACDDALRGHCDATTVYRTLMLMCEANVLRQVNLRSKARFFVLNIPGENHDHLVCRRCGAIECLPGLAALHALANEVAARHGYVEVKHDLEFHGLCPTCQRATRHPARAKTSHT